MFDVESWSLGIVIAVFAAAAGAVWIAGTGLARYAAALSDRTGIGKAFVGMLLLGGITSLPEVAVTVSASIGGNAPLAVNNLLGGVAMQVAVLAIADAAFGPRPLSSAIAHPVVLLQGIFSVVLLLVVAIGVGVGDGGVAGVGSWTMAVALLFVASLWLS
ncbi:MAG: sodium:calcium antiporter, partial [Gemmatimonadota bacterium]|nr:sodium:calcium antiporter [Gemmatimonadota bacterium]